MLSWPFDNCVAESQHAYQQPLPVERYWTGSEKRCPKWSHGICHEGSAHRCRYLPRVPHSRDNGDISLPGVTSTRSRLSLQATQKSSPLRYPSGYASSLRMHHDAARLELLTVTYCNAPGRLRAGPHPLRARSPTPDANTSSTSLSATVAKSPRVPVPDPPFTVSCDPASPKFAGRRAFALACDELEQNFRLMRAPYSLVLGTRCYSCGQYLLDIWWLRYQWVF